MLQNWFTHPEWEQLLCNMQGKSYTAGKTNRFFHRHRAVERSKPKSSKQHHVLRPFFLGAASFLKSLQQILRGAAVFLGGRLCPSHMEVELVPSHFWHVFHSQAHVPVGIWDHRDPGKEWNSLGSSQVTGNIPHCSHNIVSSYLGISHQHTLLWLKRVPNLWPQILVVKPLYTQDSISLRIKLQFVSAGRNKTGKSLTWEICCRLRSWIRGTSALPWNGKGWHKHLLLWLT